MSNLLDEAIKVGKDLEGASKQLETLEGKIDIAQRHLTELENEATRRAREIVQQARDEAAGILKAAEQREKEWTQKLHEVVAREKAVEWVKEEEVKLRTRTKDVDEREETAQKTVSEATAKQELYASHLEALKVQEDAIAEREQKIAQREQELRLGRVPEKKKSKKRK